MKYIWLLLLLSFLTFSFAVDYSVESLTVENVIFPDGSMLVHERIEYQFSSDYRGLSRNIPQGRFVEIEDVRIWTEGLPVQKNHFLTQNNRAFDVQVWLIPYKSTEQINYLTHPTVVLHIMYTAKYVLEKGVDCAQLFRQFLGDGWNVPVNALKVKYVFPENAIPNQYYLHADFANDSKLVENVFTLNAEIVSSHTYGEVRFVFNVPIDTVYTVKNDSLSKGEIESVEFNYE